MDAELSPEWSVGWSYQTDLADADGSPVRLGSAWDGQTALLVFIRHFG